MKRLVVFALMVSAACVSLVAERLHTDRYGNTYRKDHGAVGKVWGGVFGGHRNYEEPREGYDEGRQYGADRR
jgi:hypothetical protein